MGGKITEKRSDFTSIRSSNLHLMKITTFHATLLVFSAIKIQVVVSWVLTPCSVAVGYQPF
jgi:hypothetical protein